MDPIVGLTGILDIDEIILKQLDIMSLNRWVISNRQSKSMYDDKNFWIKKIEYDKLPLHLIKVQLKNYNEWLHMYHILTIVNYQAPTKLSVNIIEATSPLGVTKGAETLLLMV